MPATATARRVRRDASKCVALSQDASPGAACVSGLDTRRSRSANPRARTIANARDLGHHGSVPVVVMDALAKSARVLAVDDQRAFRVGVRGLGDRTNAP